MCCLIGDVFNIGVYKMCLRTRCIDRWGEKFMCGGGRGGRNSFEGIYRELETLQRTEVVKKIVKQQLLLSAIKDNSI